MIGPPDLLWAQEIHFEPYKNGMSRMSLTTTSRTVLNSSNAQRVSFVLLAVCKATMRHHCQHRCRWIVSVQPSIIKIEKLMPQSCKDILQNRITCHSCPRTSLTNVKRATSDLGKLSSSLLALNLAARSIRKTGTFSCPSRSVLHGHRMPYNTYPLGPIHCTARPIPIVSSF
jgi:hypothetical protein